MKSITQHTADAITNHLLIEGIDDLANIARTLNLSQRRVSHLLYSRQDLFKRAGKTYSKAGWRTLWRTSPATHTGGNA